MPEGTGVYFSHCSYAEIGKRPVTCKQAKTNVHMLAAALPAQICIAFFFAFFFFPKRKQICIAYVCVHLYVIANLHDFLSSMEVYKTKNVCPLKQKRVQIKTNWTEEHFVFQPYRVN